MILKLRNEKYHSFHVINSAMCNCVFPVFPSISPLLLGVFPSPDTRTFVMQNLGYGCRGVGPEREAGRKD